MTFIENCIGKMPSAAGVDLKTCGGSVPGVLRLGWWPTSSWAFSTRGPTQRGQSKWMTM